jgi:hypothetical protein
MAPLGTSAWPLRRGRADRAWGPVGWDARRVGRMGGRYRPVRDPGDGVIAADVLVVVRSSRSCGRAAAAEVSSGTVGACCAGLSTARACLAAQRAGCAGSCPRQEHAQTTSGPARGSVTGRLVIEGSFEVAGSVRGFR